MIKKLMLFFLGALLYSSAALSQNIGTVINSTELKSEPFIDAPAVGQIAATTAVSIVKNQGAWSRIKADGKEGWVRLLNIRLGKPEAPTDIKSVGSNIVKIGGVVRTGTTKTAATTGVKGLSTEDIRKSRPNPTELRRLDAFKAKPDEIEKFAQSRNLVRQQLPEL